MSMDRMEKRKRRPDTEQRDRLHDKKRDNATKSLRLALAMAGALQAAPAPAEEAYTYYFDNQTPHMHTPETIPRKSVHPEYARWFKETINSLTLSDQEIAYIERLMFSEDVPLTDKILFLERAFTSEGPYMQAFNDPRLRYNPQRFWDIIRIADHVSTEIRGACARGESIDKFESLCAPATLRTLRNAAFKIKSSVPGFIHCNGFMYRDAVRTLSFSTARHCLAQAPPALRDQFTTSPDVDAATMLVTPDKYSWFKNLTRERVEDLPVLNPHLTRETIAGQPVVSLSFDPKVSEGSPGHLVIDYSIAMPWTDVTRKIVYGDDVDEKYPYEKDALFMIKPPHAGRERHRNEKGEVDQVGASGESGSLVALPGWDRVHVLGSFMSVHIIENTCQQMCYSLSSFNTPATHAKLGQ
ncbi:hypothetical protein FJY93_01220 [Candidatus Kaiserbacteria bacterium]|nr:hypothetical protein [Candidatus Kaiserbacteria bacterium]